MLAVITSTLTAVVVAGVAAQLVAVVWAGGKVLRPHITRRVSAKPAAPKAESNLALNVRARRRLRRDYRIALAAVRA
jgi:hypothetical protein